MKITLAVFLAAAALGVAAPASACDDCFWRQLSDDSAPPLTPTLSPALQAQLAYRDGRGLSQAGFYNDPSAYFGADYERRHQGPYVLRSRY
jgi:hypothetical protein